MPKKNKRARTGETRKYTHNKKIGTDPINIIPRVSYAQLVQIHVRKTISDFTTPTVQGLYDEYEISEEELLRQTREHLTDTSEMLAYPEKCEYLSRLLKYRDMIRIVEPVDLKVLRNVKLGLDEKAKKLWTFKKRNERIVSYSYEHLYGTRQKARNSLLDPESWQGKKKPSVGDSTSKNLHPKRLPRILKHSSHETYSPCFD
jgi:hypothetical protein